MSSLNTKHLFSVQEVQVRESLLKTEIYARAKMNLPDTDEDNFCLDIGHQIGF